MLICRKSITPSLLNLRSVQSNIFKSTFNRFFCTSITSQHPQKFDSLNLEPTIKQALAQSGFETLTSTQNLALSKIIEKRNVILHAEPGSGSTLSYVLPIINHILSRPKSKGSKEPGVKGAIIIAPSKEICIQIYSLFRILDPQNLIKVARAGSLSHFVPIVPYLEQDSPEELIRDVSFKSIVKTVDWNLLDVFITTPTTLEGILDARDQLDPYNVNPKYLVFDEYDLLLGEDNLAKPSRSILRRFAGIHKSLFGEVNKERQFIFCGSSPLRRSLEEELKNSFESLDILQTEGFQKLSPSLKYKSIHIQRPGATDEELGLLAEALHYSPKGQTIIFCNSSMRVKLVFEFLKDRYKCLPFFANLPAEDRTSIISQFKDNQAQILVATDLISRGINFKDVQHVIQFDFAVNTTTVLHRAGRVGKHHENGHFTSFIRDRDVSLAARFKEFSENTGSPSSDNNSRRNLRSR